jgi:hypothetical protein
MSKTIVHAVYRVHTAHAPSFDFSLDTCDITTEEEALSWAQDFLKEVKQGTAVYTENSSALILTPDTQIVRIDLLDSTRA